MMFHNRSMNEPIDSASFQAAAQPIRPSIISTRLQMQTAARQSQAAAAAAAAAAASAAAEEEASRRRPKKASRWDVPRKSPRCHASTLAMLCSKANPTTEPDQPDQPDARLAPVPEQVRVGFSTLG